MGTPYADSMAEFEELMAERARLILDGVDPDELVIPHPPDPEARP